MRDAGRRLAGARGAGRRDYVIPDDVKALVLPALRHRLILSPAAEIDGRKVDDILTSILETVEAPR